MKKWIEDLLELQELDIRKRNLGIRIKMLPTEMNNLKQDLADEAKALQDAKDRVQKAELGIKQVELKVESENEEICRLGAQSNQIKKNDEYQALLKEIEHHKEIVSDLETEEIELLDEIEGATESLKQFSKDFVAREKGIKADMQDIVDLAGDLKVELAKIDGERPKREKNVSSEVLSTYNRLLSKGKGSPLSPVVEGNCGNCHLKLVPQVVNQAQKGEQASCGNCGFLVYTED